MIDIGAIKNAGGQIEKLGLIATWNLRTAHAEAEKAAVLLKCCTQVRIQFMTTNESDNHYEVAIKEMLGAEIHVEFEKL